MTSAYTDRNEFEDALYDTISAVLSGAPKGIVFVKVLGEAGASATLAFDPRSREQMLEDKVALLEAEVKTLKKQKTK